ncbi:MAG: molybdopterin molybdotransferase MoeA [Armatimonadota bacterium]|nr:MAG: molybdopterin molybdotransferase MoeA [Armatimonadota bacterium]
MSKIWKLHTLAEAWGELEHHLASSSLPAEAVGLDEALGRVTAQPVLCPEPLPPFSRSVVDGYAVRAADTHGATEGAPAYLKLAGKVRMGEAPGQALAEGQAMWIPTGGMLPEGSDAAVMVEYTREWDAAEIEIRRSAAPGENVVAMGDDVAQGSELLPAGRALRSPDIGALAALGIQSVAVRKRPVAAVFSTGNEIVPADASPAAGQIRDLNSWALAMAIRRVGGEPLRLGIVRDVLEDLVAALQDGVARADLVCVSGGSSVGPEDLVPQAIASLGGPGILTRGLNVRPGKPTIIAVAQGKPIFGLPGHPVSGLMVFDLIVERAMRHMLGLPSARPRTVKAILDRDLGSVPGRSDFVRVRLEAREEKLHAAPVLGKSAMISTLVGADGVLHIPPEVEVLRAGEEVQVSVFAEGQ